MSAEVLREFLIALGYKIDVASERRAAASVAGHEKRIRAADKEASASLDRMERTSSATGTTIGRTFAMLATGLVTAAGTIATASVRIAAGLEAVYYSSKRTNTSAANVKAFGFAASQLGSSVEGAVGTLENFAATLKSSPGYESMLKGLGVATRDGAGKLRDNADVLMDVGDRLAKMPIWRAKAYAEALGLGSKELDALMDGSFRQRTEQYKGMLAQAGLDPDEAKKTSKAFMDVWREMTASLEIIAIQVQDVLVREFGGPVRGFGRWLRENSKDIAGKVAGFAKAVGDLARRALDLAKAFSDADPKTRDMVMALGLLALALMGPLGKLALLAIAVGTFLPELKRLWDTFDALAKRLIGTDGLTALLGALAGVLLFKGVATAIGGVTLAVKGLTAALGLLAGATLSPWLARLLGVAVAGGAAATVAGGMSPADLNTATPEGVEAKRQSNERVGGIKRWWRENMPSFLGGGGGDKPSGATKPGEHGSLTALIDEEAKRAGIDPRIMQGIRAGESLKGSKYDVKDDAQESSWGPFQLNRRRGLGTEFERETGLDVRDPNTIPQQARWVADYIKKNGEGAVRRHWMGYKGPRDVDPKWGDSGYKPKGEATAAAGKKPTVGTGQAEVAGGAHPLGGLGRFTSDFGMRDHPFGGRRMHAGVDLAAPPGTPVQAMKPGKVSIGRSGDVTVTAPDGSSTTYRHVIPSVEEGSEVAAGQVIAALRKHDPRSTGPHLHLEGRDAKGELIDPKTLLAEKPRPSGGGGLIGSAQAAEGPPRLSLEAPAKWIESAERGLAKLGEKLPPAFLGDPAPATNPFRAMPLGGWGTTTNTSSTNVSMGAPMTNITVSGAGDARETAETIGRHQSRVHADLLRNLQGAVA